MKSFFSCTVFALFIPFLTNLAPAKAGEPWWGSESECHQWWFNAGNGCRIRKEQLINEQPQLPGRLANAVNETNSRLAPMKTAIERHSGLMAQCLAIEQIAIPRLESRQGMTELIEQTITTNIVPALSRTMSLIKSLKHAISLKKNAPLQPEMLAVLILNAEDEVSASLIVDLWEKESTDAEKKNKIRMHQVSFHAILSVFEDNAKNLAKAHHEIMRVVGQMAAQDALDLRSDQDQLKTLKTELESATATRSHLEQAYTAAKNEQERLEKRLREMPTMIAYEIGCEGRAFPYWNGENKCHKYWN